MILNETYDAILERLNNKYNIGIVNESARKNLPSFQYFLKFNKNELKEKLISIANNHRFNDFDYNFWGNPGYNDENENQIQLTKFKTYKLGYCFSDKSGNYIVFNFNSKAFYYFDHELSGLSNLESTWNLNKIYNYIHKNA